MLNPISPNKKLPGLIDSKHVLTMLFGADTVCTLRKAPIPFEDCCIATSYRDNRGVVRRLVICDLAFANSAGASLSAIPPAVSNNATKAGRLADNVFENLTEVMNIAVNLLTESFGARLELASVSLSSNVAPGALAAMASDQRVKIDVAIPRYEIGRLDLIVTNNESRQ